MRRIHLLLPLALILTACGGPRHEGTVTYRVFVGPSDITGSTLNEAVHVDPTDAQWTSFLAQAQATLEEAPTWFEVTSARLQLYVPNSRNVSTLQDLFTGEVTAYLRSDETGAQVDIARLTDPRGSAQVPMGPTGSSLESLRGNLNRSDFLLGLRGGTPRSATGDFEAIVIITLDVTAR